MLIITFKGVKDDLFEIENTLGIKRDDADQNKYEKMMEILESLGLVTSEMITSYSESSDINKILDLLTWSIGGSVTEQMVYRPRLQDIIEAKYKKDGVYRFPHNHLLLSLSKE